MVREKKRLHDEAREIHALFHTASLCWFRALNNPTMPAHDLSLTESRVLLDLLGQTTGKVSVTNVAREVDRSVGWASRAINTLLKMGYVRSLRDEHDRRAVYVSLTEKGTEVATALKDHFSASIAAALSEVSPEARSAVQHFLKRFGEISASILCR